MSRSIRRSVAVLALLVAASLTAVPVAHAQRRPRPRLKAVRVDTPPQIDGDVIGDAAWATVEPASGFWQTEPDQGQPSTETTEVRVSFDSQYLYVGVICYDRDPSGLVVSDSRRDANLGSDDSFLMILDTFHDGKNGLVFGTNLAGIQFDGQVTDEGRGSGGPGGGLNLDWDTSWDVKSKVGSFGWSAEMAIPFRSLRYAAGGRTWGINFRRGIRRGNESSFWAQLDPQYNLFRVSEAGELEGIAPPKQRNLQILPYALGEANDPAAGGSVRSEIDGGFDVKYGVTQSLTLDVTVNTDFAQVEVDEQQVNLNRFSLFFPEKRPFFLENAGLFSVGSSRTADLFFSRRIGLSDGGAVPIIGGLRLSGKVAGFNLGLLGMRTDTNGSDPGNDYAVARMSKELPNRSRVGILVVGREGVGSLAPTGDRNRTYAVDGQVGLGRFTELSGWVARTTTPGLDGGDHAWSLGARYGSPAWRWSMDASEIGDNFNPEVGFVSRRGIRRSVAFVQRRIRPARMGGIKEIRPRLFLFSSWDLEDFQESGRYSLATDVEWRNGFNVRASIDHELEGLKDPFEVSPGVVVPIGTHRGEQWSLSFDSNRGRMLSGGLNLQQGVFFNGNILTVRPSVTFRVGESLSSEVSWSRNEADLPGGSFNTNLGRLRVTYAFSTEILLQALVQYNDTTDDVSTNLRFSWIGSANTGLFVVLNEVREFGPLALSEPDRSLVIKYSRVFNVFR